MNDDFEEWFYKNRKGEFTPQYYSDQKQAYEAGKQYAFNQALTQHKGKVEQAKRTTSVAIIEVIQKQRREWLAKINVESTTTQASMYRVFAEICTDSIKLINEAKFLVSPSINELKSGEPDSGLISGDRPSKEKRAAYAEVFKELDKIEFKLEFFSDLTRDYQNGVSEAQEQILTQWEQEKDKLKSKFLAEAGKG